MKKKLKIVWPKYDKHSQKKVREGTINGIPFETIWQQCKKETTDYLRTCPWWKDLVKESKAEKSEIRAIWKNMSKKQKEQIQNTKVLH